jgi:sugar/nucleoside kinase (ribokinase family)
VIEAKGKPRNKLTKSSILVIGELNADLLATGLTEVPQFGREILAQDFRIQLGSASAIFATGIARLGHPVTLHSRVGADDFGRYCLQDLKSKGISVERVVVAPTSTTGVTIALSTASDRALVTFLGAIAELSYEDIPSYIFTGHRHLHMTSYFLQLRLRPSFPRIFREARSEGLTTSFDPNTDPSQAWTRDIWDVIGETDVFFVNQEEALVLTKQKTVMGALEKLASKAGCAVIKLGRKGAIASNRKETARVSAFRISPVDTTGAGDSFASGFIHSYVEGKSLRDCLVTGNACGALSALKVGGTAGQPTQKELNSFIKRQKQ